MEMRVKERKYDVEVWCFSLYMMLLSDYGVTVCKIAYPLSGENNLLFIGNVKFYEAESKWDSRPFIPSRR